MELVSLSVASCLVTTPLFSRKWAWPHSYCVVLCVFMPPVIVFNYSYMTNTMDLRVQSWTDSLDGVKDNQSTIRRPEVRIKYTKTCIYTALMGDNCMHNAHMIAVKEVNYSTL